MTSRSDEIRNIKRNLERSLEYLKILDANFDTIDALESLSLRLYNYRSRVSKLLLKKSNEREIALRWLLAKTQEDVGLQEQILDACRQILVEAASRTIEFNLPEYKQQLIKAVRPGLVTFDIDPKGYITPIRARADVYTFLGTWSDLADAITFARTALNYGLKLSGQLATFIWMIKLYNTFYLGNTYWRMLSNKKQGKYKKEYPEKTEQLREFYKKIIASRLQNMKDKAPFWLLLYFGNVNVSLASDKGGSMAGLSAAIEPQPRLYGEMMQKCDRLLYSYIHSHFSKTSEYKFLMDSDVPEIDTKKRNIEEAIIYVNKLIELLRGEGGVEFALEEYLKALEQRRKNLFQGAEEILSKKFSNYVSQVVKGIDTDSKLLDSMMKTIMKVQAGEIPAGKRVYLGTFGGKEKRMRTINLSKTVVEYREIAKEGEELLAEFLRLETDIRVVKTKLGRI
jgi:hypothetical protein